MTFSGLPEHHVGLRYKEIQKVGRFQVEIATIARPAPGTAFDFSFRKQEKEVGMRRVTVI